MKRLATIVCLLIFVLTCIAQSGETTNGNTERQLENLTALNADTETEDDSWQQLMEHFIKDPVDLNESGETILKEFHVLTPLQIQQLLLYRKLCGSFISIYELQAVPGWDIAVIKKLQPYITVRDHTPVSHLLGLRAGSGDQIIMIRLSQTLERSKGYHPDSSATNFYPGSAQKIFLRYTYHFKNLLQWGILAEKDAGEQFLKGKQKLGFDFYSAHIYLQNLGHIRSLALGDFTVNLGQGLVQWQTLAFKKGGDVMAIKREGSVLKPYNSAGESNFHRGIGITLAKKSWQATAFISYKKIDATMVTDSIKPEEAFVSSLQSSGFHRTKTEAAGKGVQRQLVFGGNLTFSHNRLHAGINGVHYDFGLPIQKSANPYNKYVFEGKALSNYSIDFSYTLKNMHFFGEMAISGNLEKAFLGGVLISASSFATISMLYRNISYSYKSFYTNAFTENSSPVNEKGIYTGVSLRPNNVLRIDAYADIFKFPWLKYRVDAPSVGIDLLIQVNYQPNKQLDIYSQYHRSAKAINAGIPSTVLETVALQPVKHWRVEVNFKVNTTVTLRNRTELLWLGGNAPEQSFLSSCDILYKPASKPWSGNLRMQYFETDSYNSRLYAYENDVQFSYSIPVFSGKGYRYYINMKYDLSKNLSFWLKAAQTIYPDKNVIGSGLDEIKGHHKTDISFQALYNF